MFFYVEAIQVLYKTEFTNSNFHKLALSSTRMTRIYTMSMSISNIMKTKIFIFLKIGQTTPFRSAIFFCFSLKFTKYEDKQQVLCKHQWKVEVLHRFLTCNTQTSDCLEKKTKNVELRKGFFFALRLFLR